MPPDSAQRLADLAVVALVVGEGTDADLDPRESRAVVERLCASAEALTGEPVRTVAVMDQVQAAVERYGRLTVPEFEALVTRTGEALGDAARVAAFSVLVAVAEADGAVTTMERTLLRHIAGAWNVTTLE
ncbi:MAG TPA: TerB family tellurite resistance protein [Rubricoccaceae bacterium]|jgi:tellurite resistance protein